MKNKNLFIIGKDIIIIFIVIIQKLLINIVRTYVQMYDALTKSPLEVCGAHLKIDTGTRNYLPQAIET